MSRSVTDFYDRLSLLYHHNMGWDWDSAVREEGARLNHFLADDPSRAKPL